MVRLARWLGNPLLRPRPGCFWEAGGTFNPTAFSYGGRVYLLYRQVSRNGVSTLGLAVLDGGFEILERSCEPVYVPRESFEVYPGLEPYVRLDEVELVGARPSNLSGGSHFGVEDPRVTVIDGRLYMLYTAVSDVYDYVRVAMTSIDIGSFLGRRWNAWSRPKPISPPGVWDKNAALLPRRVQGKYVVLHRFFPTYG